MNELVESLEHLIRPPYLYYSVAAIVLLFLYFLLRSYRRSNQGIVPFKSQGGTIEIAPQTLRIVMQNAANSVEGVERATCRHFLRGRSLGVKVAIQLKANHRLRDVETLIKKRIRATLLDQFGMESVEPIHIRVTRIVGDPMASVQSEQDEEEYPLEDVREREEQAEVQDERPYSDETRI